MKISVNVICPYCGCSNFMSLEGDYMSRITEPRLRTCNTEEGGCDRLFVVTTTVTVTNTTLKIEEENNCK